jgi:hypothetical protein
LAYVGTGFRPPRSTHQAVAFDTWRGAPGFFPQTLGFVSKARFEGFDLFEMAAVLHALLHSTKGRRERNWRSHHR